MDLLRAVARLTGSILILIGIGALAEALGRRAPAPEPAPAAEPAPPVAAPSVDPAPGRGLAPSFLALLALAGLLLALAGFTLGRAHALAQFEDGRFMHAQCHGRHHGDGDRGRHGERDHRPDGAGTFGHPEPAPGFDGEMPPPGGPRGRLRIDFEFVPGASVPPPPGLEVGPDAASPDARLSPLDPFRLDPTFPEVSDCVSSENGFVCSWGSGRIVLPGDGRILPFGPDGSAWPAPEQTGLPSGE